MHTSNIGNPAQSQLKLIKTNTQPETNNETQKKEEPAPPDNICFFEGGDLLLWGFGEDT